MVRPMVMDLLCQCHFGNTFLPDQHLALLAPPSRAELFQKLTGSATFTWTPTALVSTVHNHRSWSHNILLCRIARALALYMNIPGCKESSCRYVVCGCLMFKSSQTYEILIC